MHDLGIEAPVTGSVYFHETLLTLPGVFGTPGRQAREDLSRLFFGFPAWRAQTLPANGGSNRIPVHGRSVLCLSASIWGHCSQVLVLQAFGGPKCCETKERGEAFLLTVGAFLLTVRLLCLQSLKARIRRTFPL